MRPEWPGEVRGVRERHLIGGIVALVLMPPWLLQYGVLAADGRRVDILLLVMWPSVGIVLALPLGLVALRVLIPLLVTIGLMKGALARRYNPAV